MDQRGIYLRLDGLTTHGATDALRELGLAHCGVHGAQTLEALLELVGEPVVCLDLGQEEGVSAGFGLQSADKLQSVQAARRGKVSPTYLVKDEEEGGSGSLLLVRDVGVPAGVVDAVAAEVLLEPVVALVAVDDVELGVALHVPARWVPLDRPEVAGNLDLALGREVLEVLVAEEDDLALRNEESELVEAGGVELGDLDAGDLSAEVGADMADFGG